MSSKLPAALEAEAGNAAGIGKFHNIQRNGKDISAALGNDPAALVKVSEFVKTAPSRIGAGNQ